MENKRYRKTCTFRSLRSHSTPSYTKENTRPFFSTSLGSLGDDGWFQVSLPRERKHEENEEKKTPSPLSLMRVKGEAGEEGERRGRRGGGDA